MKNGKYLIQATILFGVCQISTSDFVCQQQRNTSSEICEIDMFCSYQKDFAAMEGYSLHCRCRTIIRDSLLPQNTLKFNLFQTLCCEEHKTILRQLWIVNAELEFIDNQIFGHYQNLQFVNLSGNKLKLNFSKEAEGITDLDLSNNGLSLIPEDAFDNLKSLKMINVSFNGLEKINSSFRKLTGLEEIYLNDNQLMEISPKELDHLQKLRVLNLANNLLTMQTINNSFSKLRKLEFFNISNNQLQFLDADVFPAQNNLQSVDMSSNQLIYVYASNFPNFQNLSLLNFNNNFLTEEVISCRNMEKLTHLNILYLSQNRISQLDDCTFEALTKLQELSLSGNQIFDLPNGLFDSLAELRKLDVSHNKLDELNLDLLNNIKRVTELDIANNYLKKINLTVLRIKLPGLKLLDSDPSFVQYDEYEQSLMFYSENGVVVRNVTIDLYSRVEYSFRINVQNVVVLVLVIVSLLVIFVSLRVVYKVCKTKEDNVMHLVPLQ